MKQVDKLGLGQVWRVRQFEDGESRGEEGGKERAAGVLVVQPCHHLGQDGVGHGGGEQGGGHLQPVDPRFITWDHIASSTFYVASLHEQSNQALSGQNEKKPRLDPGRHFVFLCTSLGPGRTCKRNFQFFRPKKMSSAVSWCQCATGRR